MIDRHRIAAAKNTEFIREQTMTIKSDRWIIQQAEAGMIEPFEPGQVRHQDGNKVISYGTSSYGYDVRCGPQFKVFTNIHSATVDPKAFDAKSFVDLHRAVFLVALAVPLLLVALERRRSEWGFGLRRRSCHDSEQQRFVNCSDLAQVRRV